MFHLDIFADGVLLDNHLCLELELIKQRHPLQIGIHLNLYIDINITISP